MASCTSHRMDGSTSVRQSARAKPSSPSRYPRSFPVANRSFGSYPPCPCLHDFYAQLTDESVRHLVRDIVPAAVRLYRHPARQPLRLIFELKPFQFFTVVHLPLRFLVSAKVVTPFSALICP